MPLGPELRCGGVEVRRYVKFTVIPQALAFVYYQLSWLLYVHKNTSLVRMREPRFR